MSLTPLEKSLTTSIMGSSPWLSSCLLSLIYQLDLMPMTLLYNVHTIDKMFCYQDQRQRLFPTS